MTGLEDSPPLAHDDEAAIWAVAAREMLLLTAGRYHQVSTMTEIAAGVQQATGHQATRRPYTWIGDVLQLVAADCARRGEPNLASLCVNAEGSVGSSYAEGVSAVEGVAPEDPDIHAAKARLDCHRYFEANLPAGGGVAALTPRLSDSRSRKRRAAIAARPVETCPRCFMALPAQGGACQGCE